MDMIGFRTNKEKYKMITRNNNLWDTPMLINDFVKSWMSVEDMFSLLNQDDYLCILSLRIKLMFCCFSDP